MDADKVKFCEQCKWYGDRFPLCSSPANGISLQTGRNKPLFASICRSDEAICGVGAKSFEPKPPAKESIWRRIFRIG